MNLIGIHTLDDLLRVAEIRGEYWIDESGSAMYADGDAGDKNHEGYVLERLYSTVLGEFGLDVDDRGFDLTKYWVDIKNTIQDDGLRQEFETNPIEVTKAILKENGLDEVDDIFKVFYSINADPREYALKHWGWKRVHGNNIETWILTPEDMQNIVRGLDDSGELDEGEEGDLEELNIEVRSTGKFYQNVPLHVLETGNPTALNSY